ncbi:MAG: cytochrome C oxidase subunit IV family protein [Chitinophagales bacterium]
MVTEQGHELDMVKLIWRTFWILLVVTIVEVTAAIFLTGHLPQMILNVFYILMSGAKAFYIVSVFMHLRFEVKYLIITILVPLCFLMFALCVFLAEGNSWHHMKSY